jgi:hypothetical protein
MQITYKYDGIIDEAHAEWIPSLINKYPYVIEVNGLMDPQLIHNVLTVHTYTVDSDFGLGEQRTGILYGTTGVSENSDKRLYFFKTLRDKDLFFSTFDEHVLNYDPIKTEFTISLKSYQVLKRLVVEVLYRGYALLLPKGLRGNT